MSQKRLSEKTYKILENERTHLADSKETNGAKRGLEFSDDTNKLMGPIELIEVEDIRQYPKTYNEFSPMSQLAIDMATIIISNVTDYLSAKALRGFDRWLKNRRNQDIKKIQKSIPVRKTKAQQILESRQSSPVEISPRKENSTVMPFMKFDDAYNEYSVNMTSEETQKELIDIFVLSAIRAKKIWKVSHANIVDTQDTSGKCLEGRVIVDSICTPKVLDSINAILIKNPSIMEEWESIALSDILESDLVADGHFIPIESNRFKEALTLNNCK